MASRAKASLLFCPPDSDAIGLRARSPLIPNDPSWCLYSSSFLPGVTQYHTVSHCVTNSFHFPPYRAAWRSRPVDRNCMWCETTLTTQTGCIRASFSFWSTISQHGDWDVIAHQVWLYITNSRGYLGKLLFPIKKFSFWRSSQQHVIACEPYQTWWPMHMAAVHFHGILSLMLNWTASSNNLCILLTEQSNVYGFYMTTDSTWLQ